MKILFAPCHYIYDETSGGSEPSWAFNIADRIASKHPDSTVVTGFANLQDQKPYQIIEVQKGKGSIDLSLKNALQFYRQYSGVMQQKSKESWDIAHHVLPFSIDTTFNLALGKYKKRGIPCIIGPIQSPLRVLDTDVSSTDIRSTAEHTRKKKSIYSRLKDVSSPILKYLSRRTLLQADAVVVINEYTQQMLLERNIPAEKIHVIPPGIDVDAFEYTPFAEKNTERFEILTVSYLVKRKGIHFMLQAMPKLISKHPHIHLRIIGDGPQKQALEDLAEQLGVEDYVSFEGFIPNTEVASYYQKAHVFVSMSQSESWGQMYLEAMATGLPVISTKNIGANSIIRDGETGYLIDQEDSSALAEKIDSLIANHEKLANMGAAARKETEQLYDWQARIIPQYTKLYESFPQNEKQKHPPVVLRQQS